MALKKKHIQGLLDKAHKLLPAAGAAGGYTYSVEQITFTDALRMFRDQAFERLIMENDLTDVFALEKDKLRALVVQNVTDHLHTLATGLSVFEQKHIVDDIVNDIGGFGPLEPLMHEPGITDILVNGANSVYVDYKGTLHKTNISFWSERHLMQFAKRIIARFGRRVDDSQPIVDTRLPDGSRLNVVIPSVSLSGVCISIRRFPQHTMTLNDMIEFGTLTEKMRRFLMIATKCRLNIIVSGGTGSGKTSLLNALSQFINEQERVVTVEDSAELKLIQDHVVGLESRLPNTEGKGAITIRNLLVTALRMRPDRIIVGECRSEEAFDMLQAMNTGHDGSMSTLHANSASDVVVRLSSMVLMAGLPLPVDVLRKFITSAIDVVVHINRYADGTRRISEIKELGDMKEGNVEQKTIFKFQAEGVDEDGKIKGHFVRGSQVMHFMERARLYGFENEMAACLSEG